jgi:hypothetical protein
MSVLRKPLERITIADLEALVAAQSRETGELEFKGAVHTQNCETPGKARDLCAAAIPSWT